MDALTGPHFMGNPEAGPSGETGHAWPEDIHQAHDYTQGVKATKDVTPHEVEEDEEVSSEDEESPLLPRGKSHAHVMAKRIGQNYNTLQQDNMKRQRAAHVNIDLDSDDET